MTVNSKTFEKNIYASILHLIQAYMIEKQVGTKRARAMVRKYLDSIKEIPKSDNDVKKHVHNIVKEYSKKKDKAYTGLLRIMEMLDAIYVNET